MCSISMLLMEQIPVDLPGQVAYPSVDFTQDGLYSQIPACRKPPLLDLRIVTHRIVTQRNLIRFIAH